MESGMTSQPKISMVYLSEKDRFHIYRWLKNGNNIKFVITGAEWRLKNGRQKNDIAALPDVTQVPWQ